MKTRHYAAPNEVMYHIGFSHEALRGAKLAVLPGDPGRVEPLAKALGENPVYITSHREYTSWLTHIDGQPVLVCSTGMGGPSVAICLEELARIGITHVIRFGTTGTIQDNINLGEVIINKAAVRLDGTSHHFAPAAFPAVASFTMVGVLAKAARENNIPVHVGISVSSDTFWPGQERYDSFNGYVPKVFQGTLREWQVLGALNYEMETSALFVTAQALGIKAGAVCGVVAKRTDSEEIAPSDVYDTAFTSQLKITVGALKELLKAGE